MICRYCNEYNDSKKAIIYCTSCGKEIGTLDAKPNFSMKPTKKYVGPKKLVRSRQNRVFAGVCGGISEYYDIDVTLLRIIFTFFTLLGFSGALAYLILIIIIPEDPIDAFADPDSTYY